MKKGLLIVFLILSSLLFVACNKDNKEKSTSTKVETQEQSTKVDDLDGKQFSMSGNINSNLKIHMKISFKDKKVTGTYYYDQYKEDMKLEGTYDSENKVSLSEFDNKGNSTGKFNGNIDVEGSFSGEWSKPDGSKKMSFDLKNEEVKSTESKTNNESQSNKSIKSGVFEDFDYSNRYIVKEYKPVDNTSNTGDKVVDSNWNTTWSLYNGTQEVINNAKNNSKLSLTVNWGFYPRELSYKNGEVKVSGVFFNNNQYATINKISNMKVFLYDSNKSIVACGDFSSQNNQIGQILIPYNKEVQYTFTLSNISKELNLSQYAVMISSDFEIIPDEEKIRRDHPEVAAAVDYYNNKAANEKERYNYLQDKKNNDIRNAIERRLIDSTSY